MHCKPLHSLRLTKAFWTLFLSPAPCCRFTALQALELKQCSGSLMDWGLEAVTMLTSLQRLSLEGCEGITDDSLSALARLPRLHRLRYGPGVG